jgi:hypothetical protein
LSSADRKTGSLLGQMTCEHFIQMFDARRLPEHVKNLALLNKYIVGGKNKTNRGASTFRVMHSNEEFVSTFAGGIHARVSLRNAHTTKAHTRQRPCGLNGLPDPLESVAVWMSDPVHKSLAESRPLRYPIFGVSTCTRSLVNMPLRAGYGGGCQREEPSLWVSLTNAKAITKTMVKATVTKETAAAGDDRSGDDKSGEENDGGDDKSGDKSGEENDGDDHDAAAGYIVPLMPWAKSERQVLEWCNMIRPTHVVSFTPGQGEEMLACVRTKTIFVGFYASELHKTVSIEYVSSCVLSEIFDNVDNGFGKSKRQLRKTASVGTEEEAKNAKKADSVEPAAKKAKTETSSKAASAPSKSSSSSSDDDDDTN